MNAHAQIPIFDRPPISPAPAVDLAKRAHNFANSQVDCRANIASGQKFFHFIAPDGSRDRITQTQMAEICKRLWGFDKPEYKDAPFDVLFISVMQDGVQ